MLLATPGFGLRIFFRGGGGGGGGGRLSLNASLSDSLINFDQYTVMWTRGAGIKTPGRAKLIRQFACMQRLKLPIFIACWTIPWAVSLRNHTVV